MDTPDYETLLQKIIVIMSTAPTDRPRESHFQRHRLAYVSGVVSAVLLGTILFFMYERWRCEEASGNIVKAEYEKTGASAQVVQGQLCYGNDCEEAWLLQGGISDASVMKIKTKIRTGKHVRWLCLESGGGSSDAGRDLATTLRTENIATCVVPIKETDKPPRSVVCGSACAAVWLGGSERVLPSTAPDGSFAVVGFHAAYLGDGACCTDANKTMRKLLRAITWLEGMSFSTSEAEARMYLLDIGNQCLGNDLYRLHAEEAMERELVSSRNGRAGWVWRAERKDFISTPQPQGNECKLDASNKT
jgi:hypothetical protein